MFYFGISEKEGWYYTPTFNVYQKVNKDVYCYVSQYFGYYTVQLYERGTTGLCTLEARSQGDIDALFALGEQWLSEHKDWNEKKLKNSPYSITQVEWRENCWV